MQFIYCPTKDKKVCVTRTQIQAGTLENPHNTVPGKMKCSENDYLCDYDKCPIQNYFK